MIEITPDVVRAELGKLVDEHGENYVYTSKHGQCVYVRNGEGSCLVGKMLINLGVPVERLAAADIVMGGVGARELLPDLAREGLIKIDAKSVKALMYAQSDQDFSETWGTALRSALEVLDA